jgi:hypothetical protein
MKKLTITGLVTDKDGQQHQIESSMSVPAGSEAHAIMQAVGAQINTLAAGQLVLNELHMVFA